MKQTEVARVRTFLVTGFEPFGGETVNPSGRLAGAVGGDEPAPCWRVRSLLLPVTWEGAAGPLLAAAETADAVLMLGQAGGYAAPGLERVAVNAANGKDNVGVELQEAPVVAGGADAYFSTLPLAAILGAVEGLGLPAFISNSAGTYLCNHVFYRLMHSLGGQRTIPAGFLHLPYLPEQAVGKRPLPPSMAWEDQLRVVRVALQVVAAARPGG